MLIFRPAKYRTKAKKYNEYHNGAVHLAARILQEQEKEGRKQDEKEQVHPITGENQHNSEQIQEKGGRKQDEEEQVYLRTGENRHYSEQIQEKGGRKQDEEEQVYLITGENRHYSEQIQEKECLQALGEEDADQSQHQELKKERRGIKRNSLKQTCTKEMEQEKESGGKRRKDNLDYETQICLKVKIIG